MIVWWLFFIKFCTAARKYTGQEEESQASQSVAAIIMMVFQHSSNPGKVIMKIFEHAFLIIFYICMY